MTDISEKAKALLALEEKKHDDPIQGENYKFAAVTVAPALANAVIEMAEEMERMKKPPGYLDVDDVYREEPKQDGLTEAEQRVHDRNMIVKLYAERDASRRQLADARRERDEAAAREAAAVEALKNLLLHVSPEPEGCMSGMANQGKRLAWYEALKPLRDAARAALALASPRATELLAAADAFNTVCELVIGHRPKSKEDIETAARWMRNRLENNKETK